MQCLPYSIARGSSSSYCNIPDHHDVFKPIAVQSCISTMKATTNTGCRKSPIQPVYRARFISVAYRLRYRVYIWSDTLSLRYEYACAWLCRKSWRATHNRFHEEVSFLTLGTPLLYPTFSFKPGKPELFFLAALCTI